MPRAREGFVKFGDVCGWEFVNAPFPTGDLRVDVSEGEPGGAPCAPIGERFRGKRVIHAPGDEDDAAILRPVWESALGDEEIVVGIEEFHLLSFE